ncbi:MAG: DKNYY domain-containing protein, partial [Candidatus Azobacteroides sp.]|nr:DKNYY domain-containing protein [Candidatus Azobacteroides sp.]
MDTKNEEMKKTVIILCALCFLISLLSYGQEDESAMYHSFEDYPPIRQMKCGLWINNIGDIAFKDYTGCEEEDYAENDTIKTDFLPKLIPVDRYLTWTYNIHDTIPDNISEDDFELKFMPSLKNVVDTTSFKILSPYYFMDKNFIYSFTPMACGGHIFVQHGKDRESFRVFEVNPNFACNKNSCDVEGREIKNADPKTFQPILIHGEPTWYSRDRKYFYDFTEPMSDKEVRELEDEFGIELFTQADYMNFTSEKFDSIIIAYGIVYNEEVSSPFDTIERDTFILKGMAQLSKSEIKKLHQWFLSGKSFTNAIPLLTHGDIVLSYYKNDTITVSCRISSLTRKFTLVNGKR